MEKEKWTSEELSKHIKINVEDYGAMGGCYNPEVNKVLNPNFFY